ncbi:hypothetical protein B0H10DRAFT_1959061 [Mycena sp. CBHHK59/15]|nr:hypothetical protein B0H10DRAFT_1959061 [Mycena sp. CBHHK59/15]
MAPGGPAGDWTSNPDDKIALIAYFKTIKDQIGQGGSWDQMCLDSATTHMVARGSPMNGVLKNANSVKGVWAGMKKIHDALILVIQKWYPGASGWAYNQQAGFSVCDDNHDAWKELSKQHTVFKPFTSKGWEFFDNVKDILPMCARDPSQLLNDSQSQPFTDWSQTQFGLLQPAGGLTQPVTSTPTHMPMPPLVPAVPGLAHAPIPVALSGCVKPMAPLAPTVPAALGTLSGGVKHAASDKFQMPWTAKKGKTSGADALLAIGGSVDRVGNTIRDCFIPQKSSAVSPTKRVERARQIAVDDQEASGH